MRVALLRPGPSGVKDFARRRQIATALKKGSKSGWLNWMLDRMLVHRDTERKKKATTKKCPDPKSERGLCLCYFKDLQMHTALSGLVPLISYPVWVCESWMKVGLLIPLCPLNILRCLESRKWDDIAKEIKHNIGSKIKTRRTKIALDDFNDLTPSRTGSFCYVIEAL
jgi:hypothetical protein